MKKIASVTILVLLIGQYLQAQKAGQQKWRYASLTQGGFAAGSSTISYTAQTIQGIEKNGLATGIGIGIDDYGMPGLPLVAHVQKAFTQSPSKPFVYGQTGIVFPLKKGQWDDKILWSADDVDQYNLHNGFIAELGAGYLFGLGKTYKHAISLSTGYSYKRAAATYTQLAWPPYLSSLPPAVYDKYTTEEHRFNYHRIVVKLGFKF